jgi:hypothetical protein
MKSANYEDTTYDKASSVMIQSSKGNGSSIEGHDGIA